MGSVIFTDLLLTLCLGMDLARNRMAEVHLVPNGFSYSAVPCLQFGVVMY